MKKNLIFIMALFFLSPNIFAYGVSENYTNYSIETKENESNFKYNTNVESYNLKLKEDVLPVKPQQKKLKGNRKKNNNNIFKSNTENKSNNNAASIVFYVLASLCFLYGIVWLLLFNWIIGLVFIFFGLIWLLLGFVTKSKPVSTTQKQIEIYKDVIYLKDGSILKGTIIEQIPNVSLKIQTGDGSVFFHKMENIEKITKEK
jgi:Flp pilus assembly protein TadB